MEFMGFHIVDIIIVTLVGFLAIRGLINGFTKELLSFIGIVAGIVVAARCNTTVVNLINEQKLLPPIHDDYSVIVGFIVIFISIWFVIGFISSIISKLTANASGFVSRVLGYILSASRYLFLFSLIIFVINGSDFFKKSATEFRENSKLFNPMAEFGAMVLDRSVTDKNTTNELIKPSISLVEHNSSN